MKILSLRQPWAHAVLYFGKTLENRRWSTRFRGEFLIHAAKGMTVAEYEDAEDFIVDTLWGDLDGATMYARREAYAADFRSRGHRGGIVGVARLVDVISPCVLPSDACVSGTLFECDHKWHMPEQYAFVLEGIRPLPFVPYKGELGFFNVPDDVARKAMGGQSCSAP